MKTENAFLDSGDLKSTTRPGIWKPQGDKIVEKGWREIGNQGSEPELPSSEGEGDFGSVGQENMPGLLPKAGKVEVGYDDEMRVAQVIERDPAAANATTTIT
nr:hypothetical protein [Actinomycetota bacterium]